MNFIQKIRSSANKFTAVDFAVFKIFLISVGILLGIYCLLFMAEHIAWVWGAAVVCGAYVVVQLVRRL